MNDPYFNPERWGKSTIKSRGIKMINPKLAEELDKLNRDELIEIYNLLTDMINLDTEEESEESDEIEAEIEAEEDSENDEEETENNEVDDEDENNVKPVPPLDIDINSI